MSGLAQPATAQYGQPNQYQDRNSQGQNQDRGPPPGQIRGPSPQSQLDEAYRTGYRAGYETARTRGRYSDRPVASNNRGGDPNEHWRARYSQSYSYNDDSY